MLSIVVAKSKNNIIGKDNQLLWYLPADRKKFNEITTNHVVIMGRKTFESIGRVLPDRKSVVFTNNPDFVVDDENVEVVHSMLEIKQYIDDENENFVIGGAMIYRLLMPYVNKMYVTEINEEYEGDTFFPRISEDTWEVVEREDGILDEYNDLEYEFVVYKRKKEN